MPVVSSPLDSFAKPLLYTQLGMVSTIYVGLAALLPESLRPLCSCAGLCYAQVLGVCAEGDLYRVEVAALLHYFSAGPQMRKCHVREIFLPREQVEQLLEWERHLASLATCDLRELLEERAAQTSPVAAIPSVGNDKVGAIALIEDGNDEDGEEEEADLAPLPTIFVMRLTIRESLETLHITTSKDRCVQTALLHAVLAALSMQLKYCPSARERRRLQRHYDQVCAVQQWRRQRREKGHGWQRVVTLEPAMEQGKAGWDIIVGVPLAQAA